MINQLHALLHGLQEYQYQIVTTYFCSIMLIWTYWIKIRSIFLSTIMINIAAVFAIFAISLFALTIALYLLYPNYVDHGQPIVASISWLWLQGHELYPNWAAGDIYGLTYGLLIFFINGMALLLSQSIFSSKVPGVISLGMALVTISILFRRRTASTLVSLLLLAALIMVFGLFDAYSYWNRPEPFLILISVLALVVALRPPSLMAAVGIGVLAGVATALKLHGFIYTVPAVAAAVARARTFRRRAVMVTTGSVCAIVTAILPFLTKGASVAGYLRFLKLMAIDDGWSAFLFVESLLFAFVITIPIIAIWTWRRPTLNREDHGLFLGLSISIAMIAVIAGKAGGGAYYFLPIVPICIYGIAVVCVSPSTGIRGCAAPVICGPSRRETKEVAAVTFLLFLLAYGPHLFSYMWWQLRYTYQRAGSVERITIAQLKTYLESYPEAQVGISDDEHYSNYFYRVFSVWTGKALHVDFDFWMDLAYAGVSEEHIKRFIEGCVVRTWILPSGKPFTMRSLYTGLPMLSESFRKEFKRNYEQIESGRGYQVWQCKYNRSNDGH